MIYESFEELLGFFFPAELMANNSLIFTSLTIVFVVLFIVFLFFGLFSLCKRK